MRWQGVGLLAAGILAAVPAAGEEVGRQGSAAVDTVAPSGWQLEVGLQDFLAIGGQLALPTPEITVGYRLGTVEPFLGFSASYASGAAGGTGLTGTSGNPTLVSLSSNETIVNLSPGVRFYFRMPEAGHVSPFAQFLVNVGIDSLGGSGGPGTTSVDLGAEVAVGAEYLFTSRFGLALGAAVDYDHGFGSGGSSVATDFASLGGFITLVLHL